MPDYLNIAGRVRTTAADGVVAEAQEVKDLLKNKSQQELNNDFSTAIEAILLLIPSAASSLNQLADKAFVNSSIATASATFRGTYNLVSDLNLTVSATHAQIGAALAGAVSDEDNNDYAFVQVPTSDATPTQIAKTERYKFNGTTWEYEYDLNNSGYTDAQWAAINSGITAALVSKLSALPTNAELTTALGLLSDGIAAINGKIPSEATTSNKLVDTAAMQSYITQIINAIDATFNVTSTDGHVTVQITQVNGVITSVAVTTSDIASASALTLVTGRVTDAEANIVSLGGRMTTAETDIDDLQQLYNNLQQSAPVVIEPTDTWPVAVADRSATVIYRVVDRVNTPPQYYSDYMFRASDLSGQPVLMGQYDNAIDPRPKKGSQNLVTSGGVFDNMGALDVSELNATENPHTLATYADLSAALAAIPSDYQKGGMSIKFIQGTAQSSDNKYVQYRLMANSFTTDITDWQGVDDKPTTGSDNLVKSGGVAALVGVPLLDNTSRARYDILFTDSDVEVGDVLVHNFASGMIAYYDSNNSVITYIGSNSGATVDSSYTITSAFSYAKVVSVGGITSATIINTKVDSCRELTKKVKDIEDSVDGLESSISDIEDDVENIGNELSEIRSERVINEYPTTQGANYDTIGNTHIYFLTNPIEKGEIVSGVSLYSKGAGTISLYFCSLDFNSNKAYLIEKKDVTCVLGDNAIEFTNPFEATGKTFIGIKGQNLIGYKNTSSGDWGTINNPLYEATTDITPEGTSITVGATTYFRYPVSLKASYVAYVTKEEAEGFATKEELQELSISCTLDNGNMLRYHKEDNGEYTLWGRWFDLTVNGTVRKVTNNAGSEIMFAVEGATSVVFTFDQITPNTINPYMAFSIDGGDFTRQQLETDGSFYTTTLVLSDAGEHIVRMSVDAISQTDHAYKWNGTNAFALVSITPNAGTMTAIKPMNKIGMFFGDSVTEGINVLGTGDTNTVQSAIEAYSYWTARYLNSVRYCIGYGGSGMTQAGSFKPCIDAVNYYKNGVPTGDFYPDYIVINHGINDYSGTVEAFITAYTAVIERLRVKYPGVTIFMVYPFMTNSANNKFVSGMETLANSYSNVYFVPTLGWNGETTDGTHLSVAGAKSNAEKLSKEIIKILGKSFFI